MSNQRIEVAMEGDAILSIQRHEHREVAELRWDGSTELISLEVPKRAIVTE